MTPSDQSTFYKFMKDIFLEEWPAAPLKPDQLSRWFRALEVIDLDRIKKSFGEYLCDSRQAKYPPKEGQILEIIKTIPFDTRSVRCTWQNCNAMGIDRLGNYFYCREHCDEMILKTDPDSIQAEVIHGIRKVSLEAKELGITGREYFEKSEPAFFNSIQKMRAESQAEVAERKITKAVGDFYETNIPKKEREKILVKIRQVAKYWADKIKCAETA